MLREGISRSAGGSWCEYVVDFLDGVIIQNTSTYYKSSCILRDQDIEYSAISMVLWFFGLDSSRLMSVVGSFVPLLAKKPTEERVQHTAKKNVDSIVLWCRLRVSIMFRCLSFDRNKFNIYWICLTTFDARLLHQGSLLWRLMRSFTW